MFFLQFIKSLRNASGDFHIARTQRTHHLEAHHRQAIVECGGTPFGHRIADGGELIEAHPATILEADFHLSQLLGRLHRRHRAHSLFHAAQRRASARRFLLNLANLSGNFGCRNI